MKSRLKSPEGKQRHPRRPVAGPRRGIPLSFYRRLTGSWVINALVVPLLISLFGTIMTLLLTHWGK